MDELLYELTTTSHFIGLIIIIAIALLNQLIRVLLSIFFAKLAQNRGYSFVKFFFICLLLGVIGICWVACLQDKKMQDEIAQLRSALFAYTTRGGVQYGTWVCSNCAAENSDQYGQCKVCGTMRG